MWFGNNFHIFHSFSILLGIIIPTDEHIFQRGWPTTNQITNYVENQGTKVFSKTGPKEVAPLVISQSASWKLIIKLITKSWNEIEKWCIFMHIYHGPSLAKLLSYSLAKLEGIIPIHIPHPFLTVGSLWITPGSSGGLIATLAWLWDVINYSRVDDDDDHHHHHHHGFNHGFNHL